MRVLMSKQAEPRKIMVQRSGPAQSSGVFLRQFGIHLVAALMVLLPQTVLAGHATEDTAFRISGESTADWGFGPSWTGDFETARRVELCASVEVPAETVLHGTMLSLCSPDADCSCWSATNSTWREQQHLYVVNNAMCLGPYCDLLPPPAPSPPPSPPPPSPSPPPPSPSPPPPSPSPPPPAACDATFESVCFRADQPDGGSGTAYSMSASNSVLTSSTSASKDAWNTRAGSLILWAEAPPRPWRVFVKMELSGSAGTCAKQAGGLVVYTAPDDSVPAFIFGPRDWNGVDGVGWQQLPGGSSHIASGTGSYTTQQILETGVAYSLSWYAGH